ncbi:hypothetical protein V5799_003448 [Amblyomma americanum]|uniref:Secreted protein n=1 Tax=Amblyomma americanum TaxID=6943 RepID=A0AAQ4D8Y0_AMBAM
MMIVVLWWVVLNSTSSVDNLVRNSLAPCFLLSGCVRCHAADHTPDRLIPRPSKSSEKTLRGVQVQHAFLVSN